MPGLTTNFRRCACTKLLETSVACLLTLVEQCRSSSADASHGPDDRRRVCGLLSVADTPEPDTEERLCDQSSAIQGSFAVNGREAAVPHLAERDVVREKRSKKERATGPWSLSKIIGILVCRILSWFEHLVPLWSERFSSLQTCRCVRVRVFVLSVFAMVSNGIDTCELAQCRFDDGLWRPLCPYSVGQGVAYPGCSGDGAVGSAKNGGARHEAGDSRGEIIVVSDAVEGISPRERVQQPTVEETVEVGRSVLHERVQPTVEETVEVGRSVLHERVQPTVEETVEVGKLVLHERVPQRTVGDTVEVVSSAPHERVQQRSAEKIEVAPQSPEETVELVKSVSRELSMSQGLKTKMSFRNGFPRGFLNKRRFGSCKLERKGEEVVHRSRTDAV